MDEQVAGHPRREAVAVLVAGVLASGFVVLAGGRTWAEARLSAPGLPTAEQTLTGSQLAPAAFAFGLAAVAGVLGVLATRGWGRRLAGGLLVLCGVGSAVTAGVAASAGRAMAVLPAMYSAGDVEVRVTVWPVATAVAAGVVAVCGVLVVWRGPRWPGMGAKYDAPPKQREVEPDMWRAFDRGDDPTA